MPRAWKIHWGLLRTQPLLLELPLGELGGHVARDVVHRPVDAEATLSGAPWGVGG